MADFQLSFSASEIDAKLNKVNTPDWSQEDSKGEGFIKNKPFYHAVEAVLFKNEAASSTDAASTFESDSGSNLSYLKGIKLKLQAGESYTAKVLKTDESTEEITVNAMAVSAMDEDTAYEVLRSMIDPEDSLDISVDQIIGIQEMAKNLESNIALFTDENQTFMGYVGLIVDPEEYSFVYDPFGTTYGINNPEIVSIELTCPVEKPIPKEFLNTVAPNWDQQDPTAPDFIANKPFGRFLITNFENEDYSDFYSSSEVTDDPGCVFTLNDRNILECINFTTPKYIDGVYNYSEIPYQLYIQLKLPSGTGEYSYSTLEFQEKLYSSEENYDSTVGGYCKEQYIGNLYLKDETLPDTGEDFLFYIYADSRDYRTHESEIIALYLKADGKFVDQYDNEINLSNSLDYITGGNTYKYPRNIVIKLGVPDIYYQGLPMEYLPEEVLEELEDLSEEIDDLDDQKTDKSNKIDSIKASKSYSSLDYPSVKAVQEYIDNKIARYLEAGGGYDFIVNSASYYDFTGFTPGNSCFDRGTYKYNNTSYGIGSVNLNEISTKTIENKTSISILKNYGNTYTYDIEKTTPDTDYVPYIKNKNNGAYYFLVPDKDGTSTGGDFYLSSNTGEDFMYTAGDTLYTAENAINITDLKSYVLDGVNVTFKHTIPETTTTTSGKNPVTTVTVPAATFTRTGKAVFINEDLFVGNPSLKDSSKDDTTEDFLLYWEAATGNMSFYLKSDALLDNTENTLEASNIALKKSTTSIASDIVSTAYTSKFVCFDPYNNTFKEITAETKVELPIFKRAQMFFYDNYFIIVASQYKDAEGIYQSTSKIYKVIVDFSTNKITSVEVICDGADADSRQGSYIVLAGSRLYFLSDPVIDYYTNKYTSYIDLSDSEIKWQYSSFSICNELTANGSSSAITKRPCFTVINESVVFFDFRNAKIYIWNTLTDSYKTYTIADFNTSSAGILGTYDNYIFYGGLNLPTGSSTSTTSVNYLKINPALLEIENEKAFPVTLKDPTCEVTSKNDTYELISKGARNFIINDNQRTVSLIIDSTPELSWTLDFDKMYRCLISGTMTSCGQTTNFDATFSIDRTFKYKGILPVERSYYAEVNSTTPYTVYSKYLAYAGNLYLYLGDPAVDTGEDYFVTTEYVGPPEGYKKTDNYITTFYYSRQYLEDTINEITNYSGIGTVFNSKIRGFSNFYEVTSKPTLKTTLKVNSKDCVSKKLLRESISESLNNYTPNLKTKELGNTLNTDESIIRAFCLNNDIYFSTIYENLFKVDKQTLNCTYVTKLSTCYSSPVVIQDKLYYMSNSKILCYDPKLNTETTVYEAEDSYYIETDSKYIYMFNSYNNSGRYLTVFDPETATVYSANIYIPNKMFSYRQFETITVDNKIYDFGYNSSGDEEQSLLIYDLDTGNIKKSKIHFMHQLRATRKFALGSKIYLYGGYDPYVYEVDNYSNALNSQVYIYDTITDSLSTLDLQLSNYEYPITLNGNQVWLINTQTKKVKILQRELINKANNLTAESTYQELPTAKATYDFVTARIGQDYTVLNDTETGLKYALQISNGELKIKPLPTEVKITTLPDKIIYKQGEIFDPTGMILTAFYSDGSEQEIASYRTETLLNKTGYTNVDIIINLPSPIKVSFEVEVIDFDESILQDFEYFKDFDGFYVLTEWKQTLNGESSTEMVIPNNTLIKI